MGQQALRAWLHNDMANLRWDSRAFDARFHNTVGPSSTPTICGADLLRYVRRGRGAAVTTEPSGLARLGRVRGKCSGAHSGPTGGDQKRKVAVSRRNRPVDQRRLGESRSSHRRYFRFPRAYSRGKLASFHFDVDRTDMTGVLLLQCAARKTGLRHQLDSELRQGAVFFSTSVTALHVLWNTAIRGTSGGHPVWRWEISRRPSERAGDCGAGDGQRKGALLSGMVSSRERSVL